MELGEAELSAFLSEHQEDAAATLVRLIRWLTSGADGAAVVDRLVSMRPEQVPDVTKLLGLASVKSALDHWNNSESNSSEEFWQTSLEERAYVLSQVFAYPIMVIGRKAYVGGKRITNRGGNVVDFLAAVESTDAIVLIEIKTPSTRLLGQEYRAGVYPLSQDLVGAVAQVATYRQSLTMEHPNLTADAEAGRILAEPKCLVVAGNAKRELTSREKRESFELQRERMQGVSIVTYDELFRRLSLFIQLMEGRST